MGQSRTVLRLIWVRPGIWQRCRSTKLQGTFPMWSFNWWLGSVVRSNICPQVTAGAAFGLICVVIFASPWSRESLQSGAGTFWGSCIPPDLCYCFGWILDKRILKRLYWRKQVHRRMWEQSIQCQQGPQWSVMWGDLQLSIKTAVRLGWSKDVWEEWEQGKPLQIMQQLLVLYWSPQVSLCLGWLWRREMLLANSFIPRSPPMIPVLPSLALISK